MVAGKVVVITGAGSGIGKGLATGFCRDGAQVVGVGRTASTLAATAAELGGRLHCIVGDVGSAADVDRLFAETLQRYGRVDVLINNAALYGRTEFLVTPPDQWAEELRVNVTGLARC